MYTDPLFNTVLFTWLVLAIITAPVLLRVTAPYGRYASALWGRAIANRLGWIIMEVPAVLVFGFFFLMGSQEKTMVTWMFFAFWQAHYINRSFVYPFRLSRSSKQMPVVIVMLAVLFNLGNGYLNGHYLGELAPVYTSEWLTDPRFLIGIVLFGLGATINLRSDALLMRLKKSNSAEYQIPHGGLFSRISCPNYLGEIIEWIGFAVATWSPAALVFAIWTAANLIPRAVSHHSWYRSTFAEYPPERKAIFPGLL